MGEAYASTGNTERLRRPFMVMTRASQGQEVRMGSSRDGKAGRLEMDGVLEGSGDGDDE